MVSGWGGRSRTKLQSFIAMRIHYRTNDKVIDENILCVVITSLYAVGRVVIVIICDIHAGTHVTYMQHVTWQQWTRQRPSTAVGLLKAFAAFLELKQWVEAERAGLGIRGIITCAWRNCEPKPVEQTAKNFMSAVHGACVFNCFLGTLLMRCLILH
jgi:hypothetical protein